MFQACRWYVLRTMQNGDFVLLPFVCRALSAQWRSVGAVAPERVVASFLCSRLVSYTCAFLLDVHLDSCDRTQSRLIQKSYPPHHLQHFESHRLDRAPCVFFVFKSATVLQRIRRNCRVRRRESLMGMRSQRALMKNSISQRGEVLFAGCRDDRPIVDSGSVVSTCPVDEATSVPTEKYNTV